MKKEKQAKKSLSRPPVVVVLGHVDHGKTSLLDKIRSSRLTTKEHGGITQAIGAYKVRDKGKEITFIDTPGHAAFDKMRSRGAAVADLALLVVSSDEGVKPQTVESLKFIQKAKIPFLVALNKIDLPNADLDFAKQTLVDAGVNIEDSGGDVVCIPVSAETGEGIDSLLEMIMLVSEMIGFSANPEGELKAVVIESKLDSHKGPVATVLVRDGSLKINSKINAEGIEAKVKAMLDDTGNRLNVALPSQPVEVLGFRSVPEVGAIIGKIDVLGKEEKKESNFDLKRESKEKLGLIVKADVKGSLEAVLAGLTKDVNIISSGVGEITESDILLAETVGAEVIGFNVRLSSKIKKLSQTQGIRVSVYNIIYELFEKVEERAKKHIAGELEEEVLGKAKILQEFNMKGEKVAGCVVLEGVISKNARFHLLRDEKKIGDVRIKSLRRGKDDVEKVLNGEEFGAVLSSRIDFRASDVLVSFQRTDHE
ncbi:GTP-binding protein [Patescibacteria group bacterium]|nr:GTP-binding protein [Patescibacteria group bacterium]